MITITKGDWNMTESYEWVETYEKIADKLLEFKNDRNSLLKDLRDIYQDLNLTYPLMDGDEYMSDVDPFTVFASFSRLLEENKRLKIINNIIKLWNIDTSPLNEIRTLTLIGNNTIHFILDSKRRDHEDINRLWDLFESSIKLSKSPDDLELKNKFTLQFDEVTKQALIQWKITIGLSWIRPRLYVGLSYKTRQYLKNNDYFKVSSLTSLPNGEEYLNICQTIKNNLDYYPNVNTITELVYKASVESNSDSPININTDRTVNLKETDNQYLWVNFNSREKSLRNLDTLEGITYEYPWGTADGPIVRRIRATSVLKTGDQVILVDIDPDNGIFARGVVASDPHPRTKFTHSAHSDDDYVFDITINEVFDKVPRENILDLPSFQEVDIRSFLKGVSITDMTKEQFNEIIELVTEETKAVREEVDKIDFARPLSIEGLYFEEKHTIERQIQTALIQGKNIIFTGPPGTGKSKLAKIVAEFYQANYKMITASSNWSTYETLGGYHPNKQNELYFKPGLFLSCVKDSQTSDNINQWLIIDELNRADIDKAFGSFFSVVTGDAISLPFETDKGKQVRLIPSSSDTRHSIADHLYYYPNDWRILATMNTADKSSLFELSYAFMRRFAFINIGVPKTITKNLVNNYLSVWEIPQYNYTEELARVWSTINQFRKLGPAIVKDLAYYTSTEADFTDAILLYVMPQLEGLLIDDIHKFIDTLKENISDHIDSNQLYDFAYDFFGEAL